MSTQAKLILVHVCICIDHVASRLLTHERVISEQLLADIASVRAADIHMGTTLHILAKAGLIKELTQALEHESDNAEVVVEPNQWLLHAFCFF